MFTRFDTREGWLREAVREMGALLEDLTGETMPAVRVSVGWPGGRGDRSSVIGQCWHREAARDDHFHIFISPTQDDAARVLDILAHEMIHALDGNESGHKGRFKDWALAFGLAGKMTATVAGDDLAVGLADLVRWNLGEYPHGALGAGFGFGGGSGGGSIPVPGAPGGGTSSHPKQTTRMLKATCSCDSEDPYLVRLSRKQAERARPVCGLCGERMTVENL